MDKQVTAEWIAQQRAMLQKAIAIDGDVQMCSIQLLKQFASDGISALDALEASMQREAEKDAEIKRLTREARKDYESMYTGHSLMRNEIARLTAERDAEKRRADLGNRCATNLGMLLKAISGRMVMETVKPMAEEAIAAYYEAYPQKFMVTLDDAPTVQKVIRSDANYSKV